MAIERYNRIEIHNDGYENIIKMLGSKEQPFDFNKIYTIPEELMLSDDKYQALYGKSALSYFLTVRCTQYTSDYDLMNLQQLLKPHGEIDANISMFGTPYSDLVEYIARYELDDEHLDTLYEYGEKLYNNLPNLILCT